MQENIQGLSMKEFTVTVTIVPTKLEEMLGVAKIRKEKRIIRGYTLKDAKKRAGIQ